MKVLYIGGTGEISYACVHESVRLGHEVTVFNRGRSSEPLPDAVAQVHGSLDDAAGYAKLGEMGFDVVCQFLAYNSRQIDLDLKTFAGKVKQYVFISSASAYQKPPTNHLITETTPLVNPYWPYSRAKAEMERQLVDAHERGNLPVTLIRPSHTIRRKLPGTFISGDHTAWRMLQGKPIVVHGDGESLWTLTHAEDFAYPFARLLGLEAALGEAYHITTEVPATWNLIIESVGRAFGVEPRIVHVASDTLCQYNDAWTGPLLGDKARSVVFDNSKVKATVGGWTPKLSMSEAIQRVSVHTKERLPEFEPDVETDKLVDRIIADAAALGR